MLQTSPALQKLFYDYTHLPIGGKEIICPYWRNRIGRGIFGPYGGKGTPEQIVESTEKEAQKSGVDLNIMTNREILLFMKRKKIGIDCSGFTFWLLDALDKEKGGNGIADDIPGSKGRYLQARANVRMLTDQNVSLSVNRLAEIKVGDMIRCGKQRHLAVVLGLLKDEKGELKEIYYAHAKEPLGVHSAKIKIVNPDLPLSQQQLEEELAIEGVWRLKIWS